MHCKSPLLRFALLLTLAASCGGTTSGTQLPAGGVWRSLTPMPEPRQELASAVLDKKIFVIAGFDSGGEATNSVFVYDPASNGWSRAAPLPIVNEHAGAAVAHGTLFAFGGRSPRVFAYDAGRDAWSEVASMSFRHGSTPAVGVSEDRIYVAGGRPGSTAASALESYDPQTNTWATLPSMPTGRSGVAAAAVDGRLYVFGGEGARIYGDVEVFDPAANAWSKLASMPTPRHGIFGSAIGRSIYLPGGATIPGFAATNVNEVFAVQ